MVVNVEQGAANPSVGTLLRISDALGVGLPALVEPPRPKPVTVTRHGDGPVLWSSESGGRGVLAAGTGPPDVAELWDWTPGPGDQHGSERRTVPDVAMLQEFLAGGQVDAAVFALRPDYRAMLLAVDGIVPGPSDQGSDALLQAAEEAAAGALRGRPVKQLPHVAAWREAYDVVRN
jgi:hypothetical protein